MSGLRRGVSRPQPRPAIETVAPLFVNRSYFNLRRLRHGQLNRRLAVVVPPVSATLAQRVRSSDLLGPRAGSPLPASVAPIHPPHSP
jgi:hypothetical protein